MKIYEAIIDNKEIMNHVQKNNIKFFDYPNAQEIKDVVIVIDPLDTPTPTDLVIMIISLTNIFIK